MASVRSSFMWAFVACAAAACGGQPPSGTADTGVSSDAAPLPAGDAAMDAPDASLELPDADETPPDAAGGRDAGRRDASTGPGQDASSQPALDASTGPAPDASLAPPDASAGAGPDASQPPGPDASLPRPDASAAPGPDASLPGPDAGPRPDAAAAPPAPGAPTDLTAVAQTTTRVDLTWKLGLGAVTAVEVYRGQPALTLLTTLPGAATSYSDTKASPDTSYAYQVVAANAGTRSPPSNLATAKTPPLASTPLAPSSVAASALSATMARLTWKDNSTNEAGFRIWHTPQSGSQALEGEVGPNEQTVDLTGFTPGATYTFQVAAFNGTGSSAQASSASLKMPAAPATAPAAPSAFAGKALTSTSLELTWKDNSANEDGFEIQGRLGGTSTWYPLVTMAANATSVTVTQLGANTSYDFQIRAIAQSAGGGTLGSAWVSCAVKTGLEQGAANVASVTITNVPGSTTPFLEGLATLTPLDGRPAVYSHIDWDNDHLMDWYASGVTPGAVYPRQPARGVNPFGTGWLLQSGNTFHTSGGLWSNLVVVATFNSWASVSRRQFVALHLRVYGSGGANVIEPFSMWAGDLDNTVPLPYGASTQGVVMSSHWPGVTPALGVTLDGGRVPADVDDANGWLRGSAWGNLHFVTEWGSVMSARVDFSFDVSMRDDQAF